MGKQFNLKDEEAIRLARELADASGRSMTAVIRAALEREAEARDEARREKLRVLNAIVDEAQKHIPDEWRGKTSKEIMDAIYDDGLPE